MIDNNEIERIIEEKEFIRFVYPMRMRFRPCTKAVELKLIYLEFWYFMTYEQVLTRMMKKVIKD